MKELIGLLFLICLVAIVVFLAAQKQIGTGMTITLLSFAVVGGFAIARFDWVKSLAAGKDGIKIETFQQQIDTITGDAVTKVQTEVAAQKQSLKMVIADANTTREKLDTQKKSLEELYSKTKAMESRLDEQNKEIDKTIEKSSQMEASISTAQSVIGN